MQEPAQELHDREEQEERLQAQMKKWEYQDREVSTTDDSYLATFYMGTKKKDIKFQARNDFQAIRNAMNLFGDFEVWERVYTSSLKINTLDSDGSVVSEVIFLSNE